MFHTDRQTVIIKLHTAKQDLYDLDLDLDFLP